MRALVILCAALAATPVLAADNARPSGDYDVTFKRTVSTCDPNPTDFDKGVVTFTRTGKKVKIVVPLLSSMRGTVKKDGGFDATSKRGSTGVQGIDGEYAISGTSADDGIDLLIVARYFVKGRPYCETSWSGKGTRKAR